MGLNNGQHTRHDNVTCYDQRGNKIPYLKRISWNNNDVQVSRYEKKADENSRRRVLMLKMYFFCPVMYVIKLHINCISVNNRGKSDKFVVTASMLLWRYELKWICRCRICVQCTWKLTKFLWRTDRRRRFLWRNATCLELPEKVLASTVSCL